MTPETHLSSAPWSAPRSSAGTDRSVPILRRRLPGRSPRTSSWNSCATMNDVVQLIYADGRPGDRTSVDILRAPTVRRLSLWPDGDRTEFLRTQELKSERLHPAPHRAFLFRQRQSRAGCSVEHVQAAGCDDPMHAQCRCGRSTTNNYALSGCAAAAPADREPPCGRGMLGELEQTEAAIARPEACGPTCPSGRRPAGRARTAPCVQQAIPPLAPPGACPSSIASAASKVDNRQAGTPVQLRRIVLRRTRPEAERDLQLSEGG